MERRRICGKVRLTEVRPSRLSRPRTVKAEPVDRTDDDATRAARPGVPVSTGPDPSAWGGSGAESPYAIGGHNSVSFGDGRSAA